MKAVSFLSLFLTLAFHSHASSIDWSDFLNRHDFSWQTLPESWEEAAFIGNGNLGATIYLQDKKLSWEINRTDLYVRNERIPVGYLSLDTAGRTTEGDMRIDLQNAEASGSILTDKGEVQWRSIALRHPDVILIEVTSSNTQSLPDISWHPALARPTSTTYIHNRKHNWSPKAPPVEYKPDDLHPPAKVTHSANGIISTQTYLKDGASAVIVESNTLSPSQRIYYIALEHADTVENALAKAKDAVRSARATPVNTLFDNHRSWWHAYYPLSFVMLPDDPRMETFYWRQIYKFGSAMRSDGPVLDVLGPWFAPAGWPATYWNMNVQLTYQPLTSANRLDLAESLYSNLDRYREQLIDNVVPARPERDAAGLGRATGANLKKMVELGRTDDRLTWAREPGNLAWVTYLYWDFYRNQMDETILRERVFPLLSLSVGLYLTHLETAPDGTIHLKPTYSPELAFASDANYDLALLQWGLETLIASCEQFDINDPRLPQWKSVLSRLAPLPVDKTGLMVGRNQPLETSHRHFSHLLAIHPLHLLDLDDANDHELAERSINHWLTRPGNRLSGFSHTGASFLYAALGQGDKALWHINHIFDAKGVGYAWKLQPNTLYKEGGGPVIETPLSVVSAVNEMLLQSHGGLLRIFPAVPSTWKNASFADLRAQGAFLVSAELRDGQVQSVKINSLAGEPCRIRVRGWEAKNVRVAGYEGQENSPLLTPLSNGDLEISLNKGTQVVLMCEGR